MKTLIEALENIGTLGDVRQRWGAKDENDTSFDLGIESAGIEDAIAKWAGWNLGDESWGEEIVRQYKELKGIK